MPRRVLVQRAEEHFDLVEVLAPNERSLQDVLKEQVQLLPAQDLGLDGELLVVGGRRPWPQAALTCCA